MSEPVEPARKPPANPGCILMLVAVAVALAPLVIGFFGSLTCPQPANEGNCGAAAAPWLLFFSVPMGGLLLIIGLVVAAVEANKRAKGQPPVPPAS